MVIVVLGFEEYKIHEAHGNVQAWMNRATSEHLRGEAFQFSYDFISAFTKRMIDNCCGNAVVIGGGGRSVGDVRGVKNRHAGGVLVDSLES